MSSFLTTPTPISHNDSLLTALFVASVVHIILLLGLNFSIPQPKKVNKSIEITLSSTPSKKAPKKANYLAPENQVAAGSETKKPEPPQQKLPAQQTGRKKTPAPQPKTSKPTAAQKKITTRKAPIKVSSSKQVAPQQPKISQPKPKLTAAALQKQIAQLGAQIRQTKVSSEQNKIKFINQVSTHQYVAAQYMKDWENKVERTGNLNYPEIAQHKGFSGTLTMDVGIRADGSIYSMRITKSSGYQALDDAAKRIVRMSAPFAALPTELLQELDVLIITRVWKFSDESGITTR
jgi:periplasmic protein TonB